MHRDIHVSNHYASTYNADWNTILLETNQNKMIPSHAYFMSKNTRRKHGIAIGLASQGFLSFQVAGKVRGLDELAIAHRSIGLHPRIKS